MDGVPLVSEQSQPPTSVASEMTWRNPALADPVRFQSVPPHRWGSHLEQAPHVYANTRASHMLGLHTVQSTLKVQLSKHTAQNIFRARKKTTAAY